MTHAQAISATPIPDGAAAPLVGRLEQAGLIAVMVMAVAVQFSIAIAQVMLTIAVLCWIGIVALGHERPSVPRFFWALLGYAGWTLVSAALSGNPRLSLVDSKQLVLLLVVPVVVRLVPVSRRPLLLTIVMSLGAASAAYGLFQWALLHYDEVGQRPQGTLGHYMTYSGLLMLVLGIALSKLLFARGERVWAALVMPALLMAMALTLSRNAWVGAFAAAAVLLARKDFRLLIALPVVAFITLSLAGAAVNARLLSMFNSQDATRLDRVAMLREGTQMVRDHPLVGVGPNMVKELYEQYRVPGAVERVNPHLHNNPMQIAAERGLPALALWLVAIGLLLVDTARAFRDKPCRPVAGAALAAVVAMLAGGMFEYNFGDSEFLMLFLLITALPFAAARPAPENAAA